MDEDKWINRDKRTGKLSIRFRVRGFSQQFYVSTGLDDNERNRAIVRLRRDAIFNDIVLGKFDSTLDSYKFGNYKQPEAVLVPPSLSKIWNDYTAFQKQHLAASTIASAYKQTSLIVNQLPIQLLSDAVNIREILLKRYSYHTAYVTLAAFSRCCEWAINSKLITDNPFKHIQLPKPRKHSDENSAQAYTLEQRDLIISAFENHHRFSRYSSVIKFLFWSGCRPGEAFALKWGDISNDCRRISIVKAYASRIRVLKGTKNEKRRVLAYKEDSRLRLLLLNLKPQNVDPGDLVFKNQSGQQMTLNVLGDSWRGSSANGCPYKGVVAELADQGVVPYLKPYSTRHTFATWAIASGASPEKVAYWIGDSVATVLKYYCHPDVTKTECLDF